MFPHFGTRFATLRAVALPLVAAFALALPLAEAAGDAMTYIEFRFIASSVEPGTFSASVRKLWRYTDSYARVEEEPNLQTGVHALVISNAPDAYLINRFDRTARHVVDPGPTYNVIVPVFPTERSPKFKGLQMGRELAFFRSQGATEAPDETIDGVSYHVLVVTVEDSELKLFLDETSHRPRQVSIRNPRAQYTVRYEVYRTDLPKDMSLFRLPNDVRFVGEPKR